MRRALCGSAAEGEAEGEAEGLRRGGCGDDDNAEVRALLESLHRRSSKLEDALVGLLSEMRDIRKVASDLEKKL